jgi:DNA helicase-2/ATP-dependent DNA helicase PcrA
VHVPVDDAALAAAVGNVEWAVERILDGDYPMRPHERKCEECDFAKFCSKQPQEFKSAETPPAIRLPDPLEPKMALAFSEFGASS